MIKKLKRKFIIINMCLVGAIIFAIILAICIFSYQSQLFRTEEALKNAVSMVNKGRFPTIEDTNNSLPPIKDDMPSDIPHHDADKHNDFSSIPRVYTLSVHVTKTGEIIEVFDNSADISDEVILDAIMKAIKNKDECDIISSMDLMYLRAKAPDGYLIAFTSSESISSSLNTTILVSLLVFTLAMIAFFFISERLAELSIKPVRNAWEQQKQFIADASHDLKTPITVILANNDILEANKNKSVSQMQKWIESTKDEALNMKRLVERMLDLAKSEGSLNDLIIEECNISELTEKTVLWFEASAYEREITISQSIQRDIIIQTNKDSYVRLIQILIDNAIKYSYDKKEVTVKLSKEKQRIAFSVTNYGDVISKDDLDNIFKRFYRCDKSRSTEGYGLGLAIAKSTADKLGAELFASSTDENGTIFSLIIKNK